MSYVREYQAETLSREQVDGHAGLRVLEFGTNWCGYCLAAQAAIAEAFVGFPQVEHIKVEDGPGRPLGRSFRVKLWPTLVFVRQGREVARLVRPVDMSAIRAELVSLTAE
ncbi:MAG: thioredoxin family protein [Alcanivorax sp.]|nr:thioredoxin family protein [Alcanivorax sp.]